jgi:excisionase family DNA binding protein
MQKPAQPKSKPELVDAVTAAEILGVSRRTVLLYLEQGKLVGQRIPPRGWWKVSKDSVAQLLESAQA